MNDKFAKCLARLREEEGYTAAARFYKANGGRQVFGFSYNQYLNFEKAKSLPLPKTLIALTQMLRLKADLGKLRDFTLAYLESLWGKEILHSILLPAFQSASAPAGAGPMQQALKQAVDVKKVNLTQKQADVIRSSALTFWIYEVMVNDYEPWDTQRLKQILGFPEAQIAKAIEKLRQVGLVDRNKDGRFSSPLTGKFILLPRSPAPQSADVPGYAQLKKFSADIEVNKKPKIIFQRWLTVRASESELANFIPYLGHAVYGVDIYSTLKPKPDSGLFLVEASIKKMFDF
ncbi:MAG: hypothetical protein HYT79_02180 [Elusimicrobia bacterium]|nr:hypothetical protein [Elusimicrobiota bacterium]